MPVVSVIGLYYVILAILITFAGPSLNTAWQVLQLLLLAIGGVVMAFFGTSWTRNQSSGSSGR